MPKYKVGDHFTKGNRTVVIMARKGDKSLLRHEFKGGAWSRWVLTHSIHDYPGKLGYEHKRGAYHVEHTRGRIHVYVRRELSEKHYEELIRIGETHKQARDRIKNSLEANFKVIGEGDNHITLQPLTWWEKVKVLFKK